ncbi:aminotransferase class V-fold PLP-dependent enzyme [Rubellimicrobium sp. CFH 75288]|uniref:aminotransferase class V-fold PLP-dependent enzyme n=1 Tax=Rubellimicrobium sp. CFH 75288 TaxID=2697034 RepID=UPI001411BA37|nr:aminotransferase class V-fold PLP-dependent enzyme [Rubellimicrobium sp. CFH 75288]NAZ36869.1 aminotransferase class V-fold PLP-dependent enzyme [Rubellimicrobium sp. CFH 75288]
MPHPLHGHFLLDPAVTFLNHGSFGACPRPVFEEYQAWQLRLERQPVAFLDPVRGYGRWLAEAREALAAEIGAEADDLVGVTNATVALNIVARSLPLGPGDEILTTDHEYAALDKTWAFVAARRGARVVVAPLPLPLRSEEAFTEAIEARMTSRTRVLFLSHITSATALRLPIERIVARARERGILTVVDGAHAPGHIPLDLRALGADFYAGNCHKWLMAPKGSAFLHARRDRQALLSPLVVSHGWTADRAEPGPFGGTAFVDSFEMQGTRDPAAFLAVPAAIRFRREHDWDRVAERCRTLVDGVEARMAELTGLSPLSGPEFRAPQMAALRVPARGEARDLQARLLEQHGIEIPCYDWAGHRIVRVSAQGYNDRDDMDRLVAALADIFALPAAA